MLFDYCVVSVADIVAVTPTRLTKYLSFICRSEKLKTWGIIKSVYQNDGIRGFYRGLSASYFGISETVIHFVIYEHLKKTLRIYHAQHGIKKRHKENNTLWDFLVAAGFSKTVASIIAYPHEVVRTRLRQEDTKGPRKYRSFFQTLLLVYKEEGRKGLYGGLGTQLVRQVPNSAIMFMTYEIMVALMCGEEGVAT